jgi:hypothetical protein
MRTYKRSRIGIWIIIIPAMAGAILAIGLSSDKSGELNFQHLQTTLFWLFLVDIGSSPLRLYKRVRPLIALLEPSHISLALAALLRSLLFGILRLIPIVVVYLMKYRSISPFLGTSFQVFESPLAVAAASAGIAMCIAFIYSLGIFITAFSISFMEVHKFLPPMLGFIGYASGYFPVGRPSLLASLDIINPLAAMRQGIFESAFLHSQDLWALSWSVLTLATCSLLLFWAGTYLVNKLIRVR